MTGLSLSALSAAAIAATGWLHVAAAQPPAALRSTAITSTGCEPPAHPQASFASAMFIPIVDDNAAPSQASDVSPDGTVVVGASGPEAFRWTMETGIVGLGDLPGGDLLSIGLSASAGGNVIVGFSNSANGGDEAFRWTAATGMVAMGDLDGGPVSSKAMAVSADGSAIVGFAVSNNQDAEAFRWSSATGMVGLGDLPGGIFNSRAFGVSADGSVITGWGSSGAKFPVNEAFRWTAEAGLVGLGFIKGAFFEGSQGLNVSSTGSVIVGDAWAEQGIQAFCWNSADGMTPLGALPGGGQPFSFARDVSADGSTIVGFSSTEIGSQAFIWDEVNGMRNLRLVLMVDYGIDLTGWVLSDAVAISANGKAIAGWGYNGNLQQAFLVQFITPSCAADIDHNGDVGPGDLAQLLSQWGPVIDHPADLNHDGFVNPADLAALLAAWGSCG